MIQDIHAHTYYSFCGKDKPEAVIERAIADGIELFGICDHNYGVAARWPGETFSTEGNRLKYYQRSLQQYFDHMTLLQEKYRDRIRLLRGIEICTADRKNTLLPEGADISMFDYCLIENLGEENSTMPDLFDYAERLGCKYTGVAHTDIPSYVKRSGGDLYAYFLRMAEAGIFWELNVNYDSTHGYREHPYVSAFFADPELIDIVRQSGLKLAVGFDGHKIEDYCPERVKDACRRVEALGIELVNFEEL